MWLLPFANVLPSNTKYASNTTNGRTRLLGHWYIPYVCMLVKCYIVRTPSDVLVFLLQSILFFEPQQQPTATERPTHCSVATKEPWRALVPSASIRHLRRATFDLAFLVVAAYRVWRPGHSCACSSSSLHRYPSSFLDPANPAADPTPLSVQVQASSSHVIPGGNGDDLLGSVCFT